FVSNAAAVKALSTVNGTLIPGTNRVFKLNWASGGGLTDRKDDRGPEFSIFVGDLGPEVTEWMLVQQRALLEMQGSFCGNRPMRISTATPKNKSGLPGTFYQQPSQQAPILNQYNDPNNTTVFVGGLSGVNSEEELRSAYTPTTPVINTPVTPTPPQILQSMADPLEPVPVQRMNEIFITSKEALLERMETE
ncbi:548_t:CDS:2, partial [Racocetra fulgida]